MIAQAALRLARAANGICAKRLVPFLPERVPVLARHGYRSLAEEVRAGLLAISPATVDRMLSPMRRDPALRGMSTTRAGSLLKHQIVGIARDPGKEFRNNELLDSAGHVQSQLTGLVLPEARTRIRSMA
jgi:hypothetical protein